MYPLIARIGACNILRVSTDGKLIGFNNMLKASSGPWKSVSASKARRSPSWARAARRGPRVLAVYQGADARPIAGGVTEKSTALSQSLFEQVVGVNLSGGVLAARSGALRDSDRAAGDGPGRPSRRGNFL